MAACQPRLILASTSPRRRHLLAILGLPFTIRPAQVNEEPRPGEPGGKLAH
ncbi:MAG: Maf family protein, partial [Acidobacteriota bacterium]